MEGIPSVTLSSGHSMPVIGMGTVSYPKPEPGALRSAMLDAITVGYRHFDTGALSLYGTEEPLGEAIAESIRCGLVKDRSDLFVSTKLWAADAHHDGVIPALQESLRKLQLEYVDLYLIHWPFGLPKEETKWPIDEEKIVALDYESVWKAMEQCQALGLAKSIGVSNFSCKKLEQLLSTTRIPPAVNQVEMNPTWQQKKLMDFCREEGIQITAYTPLGANGMPWGTSRVLESNELKEIAMAKGKSTAQISLRWIHQQCATMVVKSFKKERMEENLDIFNWELSKEEMLEISKIKQCRGIQGEQFISANGAFKSVMELWDGEI